MNNQNLWFEVDQNLIETEIIYESFSFTEQEDLSFGENLEGMIHFRDTISCSPKYCCTILRKN